MEAHSWGAKWDTPHLRAQLDGTLHDSTAHRRSYDKRVRPLGSHRRVIVVRRLPRELALLRGGLRASCETEHPDEEHTIADFIVWAVGATLDICAPRRSRISEGGDGAIHISVVSRKDTQ